ncbi:MAG: phosphoribosylanthranilate isomerase [Methylococcales bacterium]
MEATDFKRIRVKICGFTRVQDAQMAALMGVDAVGLVFYSPSPRNVSVASALEIVRALPPFVTKVGLFVDPEYDEVETILDQVSIDLIQFHGDETADFCGGFSKPYLKAIRMQDGIELEQEAAHFSNAVGLLLDAYHPDVHGGTGLSFDWNQAAKALDLPIILAGGLTSGNIRRAVSISNPYGVDVSSGVEFAKGKKDLNKMAAFMKEVNDFERTS